MSGCGQALGWKPLKIELCWFAIGVKAVALAADMVEMDSATRVAASEDGCPYRLLRGRRRDGAHGAGED